MDLRILVCAFCLGFSYFKGFSWPIILINAVCLAFAILRYAVFQIRYMEEKIEIKQREDEWRRLRVKELNPYKWGN